MRLEETVGVRAMDTLSAIRVTGAESKSWLNGQVTQQLALMKAGDAAYGLAVDVHGKILADLWVLDRGQDELVAIVPKTARDALLTHLDKYIVMEDVDLEPMEVAVITAQGPAAPGLADGFPCDRLGRGGLDVVVAPDRRDAALAELVAAAEARGGGAVTEAEWERARVRAGRPRYGVDFDGSHRPQEAGLRDLAVSFQKGCYLGQEVVCMLDTRGKLRRRLMRLRGAALAAGDALQAEGKDVGEVTSAVPDDGSWVGLGYVKRAHAEAGQILGSPSGEVRVEGPAGA
ncbi:MAG TPA: hypothetical protein DEF51_24690 [Myxococcales bacterium]|nr:hypothetical protein [Myxococcales bacterium]